MKLIRKCVKSITFRNFQFLTGSSFVQPDLPLVRSKHVPDPWQMTCLLINIYLQPWKINCFYWKVERNKSYLMILLLLALPTPPPPPTTLASEKLFWLAKSKLSLATRLVSWQVSVKPWLRNGWVEHSNFPGKNAFHGIFSSQNNISIPF